MMVDRIAGRLAVLYPPPGHAGRLAREQSAALPLPAQYLVLRPESTISSLCARRCGSAGCCGRAATGWLIDGFGPDGVSARVLDVTRNVVRLQTGYLYHYAFAMLIGVAAFITWFMFAGGALMASWPILSVVTFLPIAGRAVHHAAARRRGRRAQCALGRAVDDADHLRDLAHSGLALRYRLGRLPVRRAAALARRHHHLLHGRRRHLAAVRDPDHGADADLRSWRAGRRSRAACANT